MDLLRQANPPPCPSPARCLFVPSSRALPSTRLPTIGWPMAASYHSRQYALGFDGQDSKRSRTRLARAPDRGPPPENQNFGRSAKGRRQTRCVTNTFEQPSRSLGTSHPFPPFNQGGRSQAGIYRAPIRGGGNSTGGDASRGRNDGVVGLSRTRPATSVMGVCLPCLVRQLSSTARSTACVWRGCVRAMSCSATSLVLLHSFAPTGS